MNEAFLDDIRRLMGHRDIRIVQRYAHVGKSHLEAAAARLDGVLSLPAQIDGDEQVTQRALTKR